VRGHADVRTTVSHGSHLSERPAAGVGRRDHRASVPADCRRVDGCTVPDDSSRRR
jgi:hypothetical protein